ncbi:MAG: hypothetical protein AAF447_22430 [Myxococcota bacterium]
MSILVIIGSAIVVFLGLAHAAATLASTPSGGPMTPTSPEVREAMQHTGGLGLAPELRTTLYRAWTGFNLSHSVGVIGIGLVVLVPAARDFDAALGDPWWVSLALIAPPVYLLLSIRYWFSSPTRAISVASACILVGIGVGLAA